MPQMSPLSWISILLLLFMFILVSKSLMKSGKLPLYENRQDKMTKSQFKWKW